MQTPLKNLSLALLLLAALFSGRHLEAQQQVTYETGADGIRYQVTRRTVSRQIPVVTYQIREEKTYQPRTVTTYQSQQRVVVTPKIEQRWVSRLHGRWNPFGQPYWTHNLEPFQKNVYSQVSVQVPVTKTEWVTQTRKINVPLTTYKTVQEEFTSRVAVAPTTRLPAGISPQRLVGQRPVQGFSQGLNQGFNLRPQPTQIAIQPLVPQTRPLNSVPRIATYPKTEFGGRILSSDPPRVATGWQSSSVARGYRR